MSTPYSQDLLSDVEGYLIEARKGNRRAAQEALDTVNLYQSLRESGEEPEPWTAADDYAGDMETEALAILKKLTPPAPKTVIVDDGIWGKHRIRVNPPAPTTRTRGIW